MSHIVIAGASVAGLRAAEQLRAQGFDGRIIVVGGEVSPHPGPGSVDVEWRPGESIVGCDMTARTLTLRNRSAIRFAGLVVATGTRPRRLMLPGPRSGRHVVRTLGEVDRLRAEFRPGTRVVVVGGGLVGCEVAAAARALGCTVDIVESTGVLMMRPLGEELGGVMRRVHEAHGVTVRTRVGVEALISRPADPDRLSGVLLTDGSALHAEALVEAIGSRANTEWLDGNGLDLSDGVLCDNHMRVVGAHSVVAAGDVARFPDPATGNVPGRIAYWCDPVDTAKRAAATLISDLAGRPDGDGPFSPLPSFRSGQHGLHLEGYGSPGSSADSVEILEGRLDDLRSLPGTVVGYRRDARLVGVVMISPTPVQRRRYRDDVSRAIDAQLQHS